jgi:type IV secretory pathway ATPase VirB11/archaellum biosynthesis ATPase
VIPTEDTIRYTYLLKSLTHHSFSAIFVGETGTGKTSTMKKFVNSLPGEAWESGQMVFSATVTAN